MPERGPDGKWLPKTSEESDEAKDWTEGGISDEETQVAVLDPDDRIAELERLLAEKDDEIDKLRPTRDVVDYMFETREDVIAFFGADVLHAKVLEQIAALNRQRTREGYDRIPTTKDEVEGRLESFIDGLLLGRQTVQPPVEGWLSRCLKMVKPDGMLIQIPYENQVNNVAGSIADGYIRYERKGYKRTRPMLCPSVDCWQVSAEADGDLVYGGYCSADHQNRTERAQPVPA